MNHYKSSLIFVKYLHYTRTFRSSCQMRNSQSGAHSMNNTVVGTPCCRILTRVYHFTEFNSRMCWPRSSYTLNWGSHNYYIILLWNLFEKKQVFKWKGGQFRLSDTGCIIIRKASFFAEWYLKFEVKQILVVSWVCITILSWWIFKISEPIVQTVHFSYKYWI